MRWLLTGVLMIASLGCAEVVIDPARGHREPAVESYDATVAEDAAIPEPAPAPIPEWARDHAPPPAMPPPALY